jgi:hypothetical protein
LSKQASQPSKSVNIWKTTQNKTTTYPNSNHGRQHTIRFHSTITSLSNAIAGNQALYTVTASPAALVAYVTSPDVTTVRELIGFTMKHGANLY